MQREDSTRGVTLVRRLSCPASTSRLGEQWERWSIKLLINRALSFSYSVLRNPLHSWRSTSFANWASCPHYCKARGDCWSLLWRLRVGRASITRPEDLTLRLLMGSCQYSVTRMINILANTLHNLTRPATFHSQGNAQESSLLLWHTDKMKICCEAQSSVTQKFYIKCITRSYCKLTALCAQIGTSVSNMLVAHLWQCIKSTQPALTSQP